MVPFLIFTAVFTTSFLLTPVAQRLSRRWGMVARPGGRRLHQGDIPKLGGLPLLLAFLLGAALIYWLQPPADASDALRLRGVVLGTLVIALGGFVDDRWELSPIPQFAIQAVGAVIAMSHIIFIEVFSNPLPSPEMWQAPPLAWVFTYDAATGLVWVWRPLALFLTLLWLMGMINAVNWLDGLDGLAAGVCTIAALLFAWHSYSLGQAAVALFPLILAAALLGFLPFNFAPARIFLGSGGAYLLGYQMATLSILSPAKLSTALLVLAVPILDGAWLVISRWRQGRNPLQGGRDHLHFRLADGGLPTRRIVVGYYAVTAVFGLVAVLVPSRSLKVLLWLGLYALVLVLLIWLSRRKLPPQDPL
ncbi:MAG: undecaprenyl/decaprenyl-phosphate alpha-N-acetylglucosaminyl 1-phosphate transferase [Chloroflexi bacterium]|nr:undecaprenyl/decaprenyl-phosphate alpha-N-acetylglucosaminyl 1-phosphate transferase [Chloroflexota bacterium]